LEVPPKLGLKVIGLGLTMGSQIGFGRKVLIYRRLGKILFLVPKNFSKGLGI